MPKYKHGMHWIRNSTRFAVYARDQFDCVYCRLVFPLDDDGFGLTLDHVHDPRDNSPTNLVTACSECNGSKGDRALTEFTAGAPAVRARVLRALARPIDRKLGRALAARRDAGLAFFVDGALAGALCGS